MRSHPVWVRGLKRRSFAIWRIPGEVAPRVGAWIETYDFLQHQKNRLSHPVWVRGLKH